MTQPLARDAPPDPRMTLPLMVDPEVQAMLPDRYWMVGRTVPACVIVRLLTVVSV